MLEAVKSDLRELASSDKAAVLKSFFKSGPGGYAQNDIFIGVTVPLLRRTARKYLGLGLKQVGFLLASGVHEERLLALLMLVLRFERCGEAERKDIYRLYTHLVRYVNNWDLVDLSAPHIAGAFLYGKDRSPLYRLSEAASLWERRIAIVATHYFIRQGELEDTFRISERLLFDREDLIHKATGWMLREAGKRDLKAEERFLRRHYKVMPRTMLRYAIERFPENKRLAYLRMKV